MWDFDSNHIKQVKNRTGYYDFYNGTNKRIYVGVGRKLRHRVESYNEKDDFNTHPTKRALRKEIQRFSVHYTKSLRQAQDIEHRQKKNCKYNFL